MNNPVPAQITIIRPTILSQGHVSKALGDQRFFEMLPEFRVLQAKLTTMKIDLQAKRGCSGCRKTRAASNVFADFQAITTALSEDGIRRLKTYLGVSQLMINRLNRTTNQVQLVTL